MILLNTIEPFFNCRARRLLISLMLTLGAGELAAETVAVPVGQQGQAMHVEVPKMGLSKSQVTARFGEPSEVRGPVGTPPITRWVYAQFTVYFEGDHVIHSVVERP
jgi:hypothetical protein